MRIQRIGYTPAFGYNKKLNNELNKKLDTAAPNDEMANTIRNLNNFCNSTEELVRSSKDDEEEDDYLVALARTKIALAELVDLKYPELNYPAREQKSYLSEIKKNTKDLKDLENEDEDLPWQQYLAEEFYQVLGYDPDYEIAVFKDTIPDFSQGTCPSEDNPINSAAATDKSALIETAIETLGQAPSVIERFEPTFSSPKGFESLGGMTELKDELTDKILYPATHPEEAKLDFTEYGKRQPRGIMLYGPPGCGKTSIAEAMAMESGLPLFKLKISKAGSSYINQTSKNYESVFNYVAQCSKMLGQPCFLFIDEIDGLAKGRDNDATSEDLKQMSTLLNLIETARDRNVIVLGATNKYDIVDDAIKRRFDEQVYIGMPDMKTREEVLKKSLAKRLKGVPLSENAEALHEIASGLDSFPTSAIVILTDKASDIARKDGRRNILKEDFYDAIEKNQNLKINENNYKEERLKSRIGYKLKKNLD